MNAVIIESCGELKAGEPDGVPEAGADGDPYEDFPDDDDRESSKPEVALEIATKVKEISGQLFKEGKVKEALDKWQSEFFVAAVPSVPDLC